MKMAPVVVDLPAALCREIGRVIVSFANLEHRLSVLLYVLSGVSPKVGRLAIREPRATDRFGLAVDLMRLHKHEIDPKHQKMLNRAIETVMIQRSQLAHGVWLRDPDTGRLRLRVTRGTWQPIAGQPGKTSRAIKPEGVEYGLEDVRSLRELIDELREMIDEIGQRFEAEHAQALQRKHQPQSRQRSRRLGRNSRARSGRRRS